MGLFDRFLPRTKPQYPVYGRNLRVPANVETNLGGFRAGARPARILEVRCSGTKSGTYSLYVDGRLKGTCYTQQTQPQGVISAGGAWVNEYGGADVTVLHGDPTGFGDFECTILVEDE